MKVALPCVSLPCGVSHRPVVTSREGKALNRNYINSAVRRPALVACGIEPTSSTGMHQLRYWFASALLHGGV